MAESERLVYPRIPESNWWKLRDQFAKSLPSNVTVSYLKALLNLESESAARNVLVTLQRLGLVDQNGKPTDLANDWRIDAKYAQACQKMLEMYPTELRDLYSGKEIDRGSVEEWFKGTARLGDAAARQSAALYTLLHDATPKLSADFNKGKTTKIKPKAKQPALSTRATQTVADEKTSSAETSSNIKIPVPDPNKSMNDRISLHIDIQIHISHEASPTQIEAIFESMAKHLYRRSDQ
jgi:hypothetical protein